HGRRLAAALALLSDSALDALIAPAIDFEQLPAKLASIFDPASDVICQLIRYPMPDATHYREDAPLYAVEVSDQIMIAHSFRGEIFGPAQGVHGATFVIRVAFLADELDAQGIVV